jgi:hypothetical protein
MKWPTSFGKDTNRQGKPSMAISKENYHRDIRDIMFLRRQAEK